MTRVFIVDDHAIMREGIKRVLSETAEMRVVGEAGSAQEALARLCASEVDIVVLDLALPDVSGLDFLQRLRALHPALGILVLSMHSDDEYGVRALSAGASGFLNKASPPNELIRAVRVVAGGQKYVSSVTAQRLAEHVDRSARRRRHDRLSDREFQVLCLVADGKSSTEIARQLGLSVKTVSTFRSRIFEKLGLRSTAEMTRYAVAHGLVQ